MRRLLGWRERRISDAALQTLDIIAKTGQILVEINERDHPQSRPIRPFFWSAMSRQISISLSFLLLIALIWAGGLYRTLGRYPILSISAPEDLILHFLLEPQVSPSACEQQLATLTASLLDHCEDCRVLASQCQADLDAEHAAWLSTEPLPYPNLVMPDGVVVYQSASPETALATCRQSEQQSRLGYTMPATCYPADTHRPLTPNRSRMADRSRSLYLGMAVLLAGLVVMTLLALATRPRRATHLWPEKLSFFTMDALLLLGPFLFYTWPRDDNPYQWLRVDWKIFSMHAVLVLATLAWYWVRYEHYARRRPFWDELREICRPLVLFFFMVLATAFLMDGSADKTALVVAWTLPFATIPLGRSLVRRVLDILGLWQRPAVIIGTGENAQEAYRAIKDEPGLGYQVLGFVALDSDSPPPADLRLTVNGTTLPIFLPQPDLPLLLDKLGKPQVILATDILVAPACHTLIQTLVANNHSIHVIPPVRGLPLFGTQLSYFFRHEVLFLTVRNNLARRSYRWLKRGFDLIAASLLLLLLAPLFVVLALLVRRTGKTVFYGHQRIGRNGKAFRCLKFRSMRPDADKVLKELLASDPQARAEWERDFKLRNDPRITPIGRFLRKTSLDELPQLINVIKGEMSLVGPRPIVEKELERYGEYASFYLQARPGMTGLWQVSGRNDTSYAVRVSLDAWYVQNWSLWCDVAILFKTTNIIFSNRGAY